MRTIFFVFIMIVMNFIPTVPFIWYNRNEIRVSRTQTLLWSLIALMIDYSLIMALGINTYYYEVITLNVFVSTGINYLYCFNILKSIDNKKIPKSFYALLLFFLSILFQLIPMALFNYDVDNLTANQNLILTSFSDTMLAIILIIMYFKDFKIDLKKLKGNFYKIIDIGIKYWILGLLIMVISNIIIGLFVNQATAVNEENVQELIHSSTFLSIITIGVIAPITEELVFRKAFRDIFKNNLAFILTSGLVFGGLHVLLSLSSAWDLFYLIPYCSLGIAFAKMYQESDNIFTSIIMHIFHNTTLTVLSVIEIGVILL